MSDLQPEGDAIAECPTCGGEGVIYPRTKPAETAVKTSGERVDLLAALQRSINAAKGDSRG